MDGQTVLSFSSVPRQSYYKIRNLQGEWLQGTFYEEELQKIYKKNDVFQMERIRQQRKRKKGVKSLVKWFGYFALFNSWVKKKPCMPFLNRV